MAKAKVLVTSPAELARFIAEETKVWAEVLERLSVVKQ